MSTAQETVTVVRCDEPGDTRCTSVITGEAAVTADAAGRAALERGWRSTEGRHYCSKHAGRVVHTGPDVPGASS